MRYKTSRNWSKPGYGPLHPRRPRRPHRGAPGTAGRSGFTLIEMTVVIGIIMILATIAIVAYRYVDAKNSADTTRANLHNAAAMVAELDRTGQGWRLEGLNGSGLFAAGATFASPGDVNGLVSTNPSPRKTAATACSNVLNVLLPIQANQDAYGKLSSKALLADPGPGKPTPAALVDAWGNPMIWVPSGGLTGVQTGSKTNSSGTVTYSNTVPIRSPDGRGFWASAGPDGNFNTGDDNLYSFQK